VADSLAVVETHLRDFTVEGDALDEFEPHHLGGGQLLVGVALEHLRAEGLGGEAEDCLCGSQQLHRLYQIYI
jgi:hypothetical protein